MNIAFTAPCVGHTFFGRGELGYFHSFDWCSKFGSNERVQVYFTETIRPRMSSPFLRYRSSSARGIVQRCHWCTSEISWGIQRTEMLRYRQPKLSCRMWSTVLLHTQISAANSRGVHRLSASNREVRSWTVLFSTWGLPVQILSWKASLPSRNALTHRATVRYGNAASPHASSSPWKHLVYYDTSCHLQFDPGMSL